MIVVCRETNTVVKMAESVKVSSGASLLHDPNLWQSLRLSVCKMLSQKVLSCSEWGLKVVKRKY